MLSNLFSPRLKLKTIEDLDLIILKKHHFKGLFIDLDNTLIDTNTLEITQARKQLINDLKQAGFTIILFSNNTKKRVSEIAQELNVAYSYYSLKPLPFKYLYLLKKFSLSRKEVCVIGDQILTDILGANILKIYSILVENISCDKHFLTRLTRKLEAFIRKVYKI